jgi:hypothetical protein
MLANVEHVLDLADERVAEIEAIYKQTLRDQEVSGRLQALIGGTISDWRRALEFTVNEIAKKHGVAGRSVYWPNAKHPADFNELFDKNLPGLRTKKPKITTAFRNVQWYKPGYEWVSELMALYRGNQHHDFTPQTRQEHQAIRFQAPGGGASIQLGEGASITMGAGADIRLGGVSIRDIQPERLTFVDWLFDETGTSALGTLKKVQTGIRKMLQEISSASGL